MSVAAVDANLDIAGSLFVVGGEPYTPARSAAVQQAGCYAASNYYVSELGQIGVACAEAEDIDDVHFARDTVAVIQRQRELAGGQAVGALFFTTLSASAPKLMLNVESGDHGLLDSRSCACPAAEVGLTLHVRAIRSYEKVTVEGMQFFGSELATLIDDMLPVRFGGRPQDYQFVEDRGGQASGLEIVASPSVGPLEDDRVIEAVLVHLRSLGGGQHAMAEVLARARSLSVVRAVPFVSDAGKTPYLRVRVVGGGPGPDKG